MNSFKCVLLTCLFAFLISGCGGGSSGSTTPPPIGNPLPLVSSITPTSVTAGTSDTVITLSGSGFISSSVAQWNSTALATTFVSNTQLKATLPAANLSGSSTAGISVQNPAPGGGTSPAATFTVNSPIPAIVSISPQVVPTGSAATITITGSGFESNSIVMWNNSARSTTFVNSTSLQVALTAADLQSQGTGNLTVSNPGPGASTSPSAPLTVTSQPIPTIQNVAIASRPGLSSGCQQLQATITGQNFDYNATVQVNGVTMQNVFSSQAPTSVVAFLPLGFINKPGALTFTVTNPNVPLVSQAFSYPSTAAPVMSLCTTPSPTTVFPNSNFSFTVQPSEVNSPGNGTLTLGSLPTGVTVATSTVPLPPAGATIHLQAATSTAAATYDLALTGTVGAASATSDFNFTVSTAAPPTFYLSSTQTVLGVPIGGSGSIQYSSMSTPGVDFDITPSVTGLPSGTAATFSPTVFSVGQSVTVTLSAANNAPVTQNASVTLVGTPAAQTATASASFFVDVTQPPGSLPGSRTDFVSTAGTPYGAVYDPTHNLIFVSVPDWNRVYLISSSTHKIVKTIPVRSPRSLDITPDYSRVWVQTATQLIYGIDTTTLQANQYVLPSGPVSSSGLAVNFSHDTLLALSDGTVFLYFDDSGSGGGGQVGVWNPQTNKITILASGLITGWDIPIRSGDGTVVYASNESPYSTGMDRYDVSSKTLSTIYQGSSVPPLVAVNHDGSRLVLSLSSGGNPGYGLGLYDSSLNPLASLFQPMATSLLKILISRICRLPISVRSLIRFLSTTVRYITLPFLAFFPGHASTHRVACITFRIQTILKSSTFSTPCCACASPSHRQFKTWPHR